MRNYRGSRIYQCEVDGSGRVKAAIAVFDSDLDVIPYPKFTTNNIVVVGIRTKAWEIAVVFLLLRARPTHRAIPGPADPDQIGSGHR